MPLLPPVAERLRSGAAAALKTFNPRETQTAAAVCSSSLFGEIAVGK